MSFKELYCNSKNSTIIIHLLSFLSYEDLQQLLIVCKDIRHFFQKNPIYLEKKIFEEKLNTQITRLLFTEEINNKCILWYSSNITGWIMSTFSFNFNYLNLDNIPETLKKYYILEKYFLKYGNTFKICVDNITYFFCPKTQTIQLNHLKICQCCIEYKSTGDPWHLLIYYDNNKIRSEFIWCFLCSLQ